MSGQTENLIFPITKITNLLIGNSPRQWGSNLIPPAHMWLNWISVFPPYLTNLLKGYQEEELTSCFTYLMCNIIRFRICYLLAAISSMILDVVTPCSWLLQPHIFLSKGTRITFWSLTNLQFYPFFLLNVFRIKVKRTNKNF